MDGWLVTEKGESGCACAVGSFSSVCARVRSTRTGKTTDISEM